MSMSRDEAGAVRRQMRVAVEAYQLLLPCCFPRAGPTCSSCTTMPWLTTRLALAVPTAIHVRGL